MASPAQYRNPAALPSENSSPRRPANSEHSRQPLKSPNQQLPFIVDDDHDLEKGHVVWSDPQRNYTFLEMEDGRQVHLHRNDFAGDWPPPYHKLVVFKLIPTPQQKCKWKAKFAKRPGGAQ
jgi:hypothetical protein